MPWESDWQVSEMQSGNGNIEVALHPQLSLHYLLKTLTHLGDPF